MSSTVSRVRVSENVKNNLLSLSQLTNDDFLRVWDAALKLLAEDKKIQKPSLVYSIEDGKGHMEHQAEKLCGVLESILKESTSEEELLMLLTSAGLQKERASLFVAQLEHLKEAVLTRNLHSTPREQLVDLHWKFGVVAGSSEEDEVGRTYVQVKFLSQSTTGSLRSHHIEMSLKKFYEFLHQLEKAKASLEYVNYM